MKNNDLIVVLVWILSIFCLITFLTIAMVETLGQNHSSPVDESSRNYSEIIKNRA